MYRKEVAAGLAHRCGLNDAQHNEYSDMTLREIAVERLKAAGQEVGGLAVDEIFERAMQSSDFTNILADVANKAVLEGFEAADETYDVWADTTGRVNDFREHVFASASEAPSFIEIDPDGGEYTNATMTDAKEAVTAVD